MAAYYNALYSKFNRERFENLTETFGLDPEANLGTFSKGMRRQAATILALSTMPDYLFFDETFDGLDPVMRRQVWSLLLSDVAQHGTTVLISSHNLRELEDICDHVGIMDHGRMLLERSLADMQGNTVKLQMVGTPPENLEILHESASGRLHTYIVRGSASDIAEAAAAANPVYYDVLPLSLEEIFISETEVIGYDIKKLIF